MKTRKTLFVLCLLFLSASVGFTQTKRKRSTPRTSAPKTSVSQPAPLPSPIAQPSPRQPRQPIRLAIVNGQTLTTSDIDPQIAEAVERLDEKLAAARQSVLDMQINTMLLEAEGKKRSLRTNQVYEQEVIKRVVNPSEAEIKKFIDENKDQLGNANPAAVRTSVIAFLRNEQEGRISAEFVRRLRASHPVVMGASLNQPNLSPEAVVVTVGGRPVTAGPLLERLKPILYRLRLAAFEVEMEALDQIITNMLLLAEANRRSIGPEVIVRSEVSDKVKPATDAEISKFYEENKSRMPGDLNSVKVQLANYLATQEAQRLERALAARLRKGADVRYLISEPEPPVQLISVDDDPSRGPVNAAVTVVEFTDFQCPSCAAMHPVIEETLKAYPNKVRFVVRDFPLNVHPNSHKAAEAANAANAQGKFFEYAALLFKRQNALDVPSLKKYATELGLDRTKFDLALDRDAFVAEVRKDIEDGDIYGVEATPTVFVNGKMLVNLTAEGLREAIDRALAASAAKTSK